MLFMITPIKKVRLRELSSIQKVKLNFISSQPFKHWVPQKSAGAPLHK